MYHNWKTQNLSFFIYSCDIKIKFQKHQRHNKTLITKLLISSKRFQWKEYKDTNKGH